MTSTWQAALIKCRYEPRFILILMALLRILICLWPQTGYLHPDEFFQSTEIVAGNYFKSRINVAWEFKTDKPIRCMIFAKTINSMAYKVASRLQDKPSAYMLLVVPRLLYTLLTFIVDFCLYKLCRYYSSRGLWYFPVSLIFQTSFVCLGCMTRTLSNTIEVIIFALLLVVVCQTLKPRFRIVFITPNKKTQASERVKKSTQLLSSILVGALITIGIFNRPTFLCFALVPFVYWVLESYRRNSQDVLLTAFRVIAPVALSAFITAILISAYDTIYYRGSQFMIELYQDLLNLDYVQFYSNLRENWIVTPYNFIIYNTNINSLRQYGLHPPYTHMLVNLPLVFGTLAILFYAKLTSLLIGSGVNRLIFSSHRVYSLMLLSTLVSIILLSFIPHQEFRFLLPIIIPLVYTFAHNIYASNKLMYLWLAMNLILICFYSSVHQAGVLTAVLNMDPILKSHFNSRESENSSLVHIWAMRSYFVPGHLWNIPEDDGRFEFNLEDSFDDFESSRSSLMNRLAIERSNNTFADHKLFIMLPSLYRNEVERSFQDDYSPTKTSIEQIFHILPHFSGEDIGNSIDYVRKFGLSKWREAFGYSVLRIKLSFDKEPTTTESSREFD